VVFNGRGILSREGGKREKSTDHKFSCVDADLKGPIRQLNRQIDSRGRVSDRARHFTWKASEKLAEYSRFRWCGLERTAEGRGNWKTKELLNSALSEKGEFQRRTKTKAAPLTAIKTSPEGRRKLWSRRELTESKGRRTKSLAQEGYNREILKMVLMPNQKALERCGGGFH